MPKSIFIAKAIGKALNEMPYANRRLFHFFGLPLFSFFQSFKTIDIAVAIERNIENYNAVAYIEILRNVENMSLLDILKSYAIFQILI